MRKFTGTDRNGLNYRNGPERTLIIHIASSVFSYFDRVYMYRLIPGRIYDLYNFPQIVAPFLVYVLIQIHAPIAYLHEMLVMKL